MKKILLSLLLFPMAVYASETGESCAKIEDKEKRLECYDYVFQNGNNNTKDEKSEEESQEEAEKLKDKLRTWSYNESKDEMRGTSNYLAIIGSENQVNFDFPYNGGSNATIVLRKNGEHGNDIMLGIIKGQFLCRYPGCSVAVKFDDKKVEKYSVAGNATGSNEVLFISGKKNLKKFVENLKHSKKVMIELPFYNYGKRQFSFNVEGLEWKHF